MEKDERLEYLLIPLANVRSENKWKLQAEEGTCQSELLFGKVVMLCCVLVPFFWGLIVFIWAVAGWVAGRLKACHASTNFITASALLIENYSAAISGLWPWGGSSPAPTLLASVAAVLAPSRFGALRLPCSLC